MSTESVNRTGSGTAFLMEQTALGRRVADLLSQARENRKASELRWNDIQAALEVEPGSSPGGKFKESNASEDWRSKDQLPYSLMKVRAAQSVGENVVLKSDQVPVRARVPDSIRSAIDEAAQAGEGGGMPSADMEAAARKDLLELLKATDAQRELLELWEDGARLGESISHVTESVVDRPEWQADEQGGFSRVTHSARLPGCERVDVWECFRDMEHPRLDAGRYFFREQPADKSDVAELVSGLGEIRQQGAAADTEPAGGERQQGAAAATEPVPVFSMAAVVRALNRHGVAQGEDAAESAGDESQSPGRRITLKRSRTGSQIEGWVRVPRKEVEDFAAHWARDTAIDVKRDSKAAAEIDHVSINQSRPFECDPLDEADTILVQVFVANGELVGFNPDPGKLTYHREVWEKHANGIDGYGVAEAAKPFQTSVTGQLRSFMDNSKLLSNLILAVQRGTTRTKIEDVFKEGGVIEVDADDDIRKAVQQLQLMDVTGSLLKGIDMMLHFGDLGTQMPREFHGQQPEYQSTATEVTARMDQAGNYVTSVARRFDGHVVFITGHYESYLETRHPVEFSGTGAANVAELVQRFQRVMQMFNMILNSDTLARWARMDWWLRETSEMQEIPFAEAWKTPDEVAAEAEAERESEERQLMLAEARGKAAKLEAEADRARADAELKRGNLSMDRAKLVSGLEQQGQGRRLTGEAEQQERGEA